MQGVRVLGEPLLSPGAQCSAVFSCSAQSLERGSARPCWCESSCSGHEPSRTGTNRNLGLTPGNPVHNHTWFTAFAVKAIITCLCGCSLSQAGASSWWGGWIFHLCLLIPAAARTKLKNLLVWQTCHVQDWVHSSGTVWRMNCPYYSQVPRLLIPCKSEK